MQTTAADPNRFAQQLFQPLPRRYDALEAVLSLAQNGRWRREMLRHVAASRPAHVLDVATGTAGVAIALTRCTNAHVAGLDITPAMLQTARERIERAGVADAVQVVAGRAEELPFPDGEFDALTFTYLLRYVADPAATLRELARVLRPGAPVASLEFAVPDNSFWRAWWRVYTRAVLPLTGLLTGGRPWARVGRFLGPNIEAHYRRYPVDWTIRAFQDAGFVDVGVRRMSLGGGIVMWARTRDG